MNELCRPCKVYPAVFVGRPCDKMKGAAKPSRAHHWLGAER